MRKRTEEKIRGIDKDIENGLGQVIFEDDDVKAVAVKGEELFAAVAERAGKLTMAVAHAYTKGAKIMACACFEALGEYIETDDDHGAPMLPKLSPKAACMGLKLAFAQEGGDYDDFMKYRDTVGKRESKLLAK